MKFVVVLDSDKQPVISPYALLFIVYMYEKYVTENFSGNNKSFLMILGFYHSINEIYTLLGFYAAQNGSFLSMFHDSLLVPSSWVKLSFIVLICRYNVVHFFFRFMFG